MSNLFSKAKIKHINGLKLKKFRQKYNNFIAEGDKIVRELLQNYRSLVVEVFATKQWIEKNQRLLRGLMPFLTTINEKELKKISNLKTPNHVLAIVKMPKHSLPNFSLLKNWVLVLDGIQDPGNMGTIIRTADWFGINSIVCSQNSVDIYNSKVIQSSMGSFIRMPIFYMDLAKLFTTYNEIPVYGAVMDGENLYKTDFSKTGFVVIGNEGKGISNPIKEQLNHKITIPSYGKAESLNAAIATGIICSKLRENS